MIKIDIQQNAQARQRFDTKCHVVKQRIESLQAKNERILLKLEQLMKKQQAIRSSLMALYQPGV